MKNINGKTILVMSAIITNLAALFIIIKALIINNSPAIGISFFIVGSTLAE